MVIETQQLILMGHITIAVTQPQLHQIQFGVIQQTQMKDGNIVTLISHQAIQIYVLQIAIVQLTRI